MTEFRAAAEADLPGVMALIDRVFRTSGGHDPTMAQEFPALFDAANAPNLLIAVEDGAVLSHVGVLPQEMVTGGCRLPAATIGAVGTEPQRRGQGLAGRLMDLAIDRARAGGAVLMPISGGRSLYSRRGAIPVEAGFLAECTPRTLAALADPDEAWQVLRFVPADHMHAVSRLHEREATRYAWPADRTPPKVEAMLAHGCSGLIAVDAAGQVEAWMLYRHAGPMGPREPGTLRVLDLCGSRRALGHLCASVARYHEVAKLEILGLLTDYCLLDMLARAGVPHKPRSLTGCVILLNAEGLLERTRPLLAERMAPDELAALSVADDGEAVMFRFGDQSWRVEDRALAGRICLDVHQDWAGACPRGAHRVADVLLRAMPIPLPDYGVCYV